MKNVLTLCFALLSVSVFAQLDIGFYGMRTTVPGTSFGSGWGGGFLILSRPLDRSQVMKPLPFKVQLGAGYYFAGAGQKKLEGVDVNGVPDPETEISFSNIHLNFYGYSRISLRNDNSRRIPYLDLFAGGRYLNASQSIISGCDTSGATLSSYTGFSGGAGIGVLMKITNSLWLDAGVTWQGTLPGGQFVNMASVQNTGDGIAYNLRNAPTGMMIFKIGLSFRTSVRDECCDYPGCTIPSHHLKTCEVNGDRK
jgi:hypothetical protein